MVAPQKGDGDTLTRGAFGKRAFDVGTIAEGFHAGAHCAARPGGG
jgi:hypothetical protein